MLGPGARGRNSDGELEEALALGSRKLEAKDRPHRRRNVNVADGPLRARSLGRGLAASEQPNPPAGVVAAAMVGEAIAVDVSVAPYFGNHKHRGAIAEFGRGLDRLPELPYQAVRALDRLKV